jgi:hypothetical protein
MDNDIIIIGTRTHYGGEERLFGITPQDARHHLYVIGKTGSGKTTLLRNLLIQHACAGRGFALIDPHGDLAEEILQHIPMHRADDLVYFNPADLEYPIGVNLIGQVPPDDRHLVASGIVSALKSIWGELSWGPRMEYILYNAVAALLDCENTTLLGLPRLLTDPAYREWVVRQVKDPVIRAFWVTEFAAYDERFMREAIAPIQNKIGQFLASPPVRNILGQVKSKIDFRFMMDTGRMFIANLSKGRLGEDKANLLGSLVVTQFQLAAMSRATMAEESRRDFFLLIDEFQNFTTDAFASVLSEARKYHLCLTLSHQYIDQLTPKVRSAVLGNVGGVISFRIGSTDAEILTREFGGDYAASQFVELDRFEVLARILNDGESVGPFRARTLPPISNAHTKRDALIARSREKYGSKRSVVEGKINRWFQSDAYDA